MSFSTGKQIANPFAQRLLDLAVIRDGFFTPTGEQLGEQATDVWGGGGVHTSAVAITQAGALLTLAADRVAYTGQGDRLLLDPAGRGFTDVPYANNGATTYYLAARYAYKPTGGILGFEGTPGFASWEEAIGLTLTPDSVVNLGSTLQFVLSSALPARMRWSGTGDDRPVTVWKVTPASGGAEAVAQGTLVTDGAGAYTVTIGHFFGQSVPSTTAGDYRVLVEGLEIGTSALATDAAVVYLGTMLAGVHTSSTQRIINAVGDWIAAYNVEHDVTTGYHTTIRPQAIVARGGSGDDLDITGDQVMIKASVGGAALAALVSISAGSACGLQNSGGTSKVRITENTGDVLVETNTAADNIRVDAVAGTTTLAGATLESEDTHHLRKGALATASAANRYYGYESALRFTTPIPLTGWTSDAPPSGPHGIQYDSGSTRGLILTNADGSSPADIVAARDLEFFQANATDPDNVYELKRVSLSVLWGGAGTFDLHLREVEIATGTVNKSSSRTSLNSAGTYLIPSGADLSGWTVDPSIYRYVVEIAANNVTNGFTGVNLTGGSFDADHYAIE